MATIQIENGPTAANRQSGPLFFSAGFRPFFLLAGLDAALTIFVWLGFYSGFVGLKLPYSPALWHGHEMVFGFGAAAVAGFLLTAVPNWTGARISGRPVMVLTLLWLAGRLAFWASGLLPGLVVAVVDLAFLPALAVVLARPLIAAGKVRNLIFVPILGLYTLANLLIHVEAMGVAATGSIGLYLAIYLLALKITIIGGRIIPSFTATALRMSGTPVEAKSHGWIEKILPFAMIAAAVADSLIPGPLAAAVLLAVAAMQAVRLSGWHGLRTLNVPLLWVLHAGYAWLVIGLALRGLAMLVPAVPATAALHAITVGAIGMMVLGVMSRAALGHSGRPLVPAKATIAAYWLIGLAALVRVFMPILLPGLYSLSIDASGLLWSAGFLIYSIVYWPVCTKPRADGRAG